MASLIQRNWEQGHVYLIQYPRAGCIPSASPYCLKLETWLRLAKIPFSNVSNEFTKKSAKGQNPFIELNGRQIADSNFIIAQLKEEFGNNPDAHLSREERGVMTAYMALIENSLAWCNAYNSGKWNSWLATDAGFAKHFGTIKLTVIKLFLGRIRKAGRHAAYVQGIGRHSQEQVDSIATNALDSLELLIGNKPYFFGERATTLDVTAFSHITQFIYTPQLSNVLKGHLEKKCPNLVAMFNRMKEDLWSDWQEAIKTFSLSTNEPKELKS